MKSEKKGLGRGLDVFFGEDIEEVEKGDDSAIDSLIDSIDEEEDDDDNFDDNF